MSRSYCSAWLFSTSTYTIAHEFGHNLGLSHAVAPTSDGIMKSYDSQAIMSSGYIFTDYIAAHRYQMGVLRQMVGEVIEWTLDTPVITLQSISAPLGQAGADYVSMKIPC